MRFVIENESSISLGTKFDCAKGLYIGHNCVIGSSCRLDSRGHLTIGSNVSLSEEVIILTADHNMNDINFTGQTKKVIIEDFVFIGTRALILPGVTIGKAAIIAAGAVVTKDVNPFSVVAGVPAKFIKQRPNNLNYTASYRRILH